MPTLDKQLQEYEQLYKKLGGYIPDEHILTISVARTILATRLLTSESTENQAVSLCLRALEILIDYAAEN